MNSYNSYKYYEQNARVLTGKKDSFWESSDIRFETKKKKLKSLKVQHLMIGIE